MRLSEADLRLIERASYDIMSPLRHPSLTAWRRTVMERCKVLCGADGATCTLFLPGVPLHQSDEYPDMNEVYEQKHRPVAERFRLYERAMALKVWSRDTLWPDLEYLYSSSYYHEYIVPNRAFDTIGLGVTLLAQAPGLVTVHHADPHGRKFGERGLALLRLLRPAFMAGVRAIELNPSYAGGAFIGRLEASAVAASVHTSGGTLVHQTARMREVLCSDTHHELRAAVQGVVSDTRRLAFPVRAKRGDTFHSARVSRSVSHSGGSLAVTGTLSDENGWGDPLILVIVTAGVVAGPEEKLMAGYRLTRQEAAVARMLCERLTNTEIAERLRISGHTARHHTESVLSKLGVRSRRDVARILGDSGTQ